MDEYILSCCSTCDITREHLERIRVPYAHFHFIVNGKEYPDDLGESMPHAQLYSLMEQGAEVRTSQVSVGEFVDFFTGFLKEGKDILHISFSTGLSGAYNAATSAAEILAETFPERKLYVIDSLAASSGHGLLVDKLAELRDSGYTIDQLRDEALSLRHKVNHLFFSTTLKYYVKGGRISKAEGFVGGMLSICPLLCMSPEGKLVNISKVKGKRRVIEEIVNEMEKRVKNGRDYDEKCYISQSACLEDAEAVAALIRERFPKIKEVLINSIGSTIGSHTGPGTVAVFFFGAEDRYV